MNAYSKLLGQAVLGLGLTVSAISGAYAATIGFSGDTTGGPTYNRPVAGNPPTALSGVGTAVHYQVLGFTVSTNETYSVETTSASFGDTFITLYSGSFDSNNPLTNALVADDDGGTGSLSLFSRSLAAATQYYLVVTSFSNVEFGTFTGTISAESGTATLDQSNNVPVPSSFALLALGGLAFLRRRRA
jgi:PEP-CTERM motif